MLWGLDDQSVPYQGCEGVAKCYGGGGERHQGGGERSGRRAEGRVWSVGVGARERGVQVMWAGSADGMEEVCAYLVNDLGWEWWDAYGVARML